MKDTVHVKGLSELDAFLSQLPAKLEKNIMRGSMRAAAVPVAAQAKQNVSVVSGLMRDGIKIKTGSKNGVVKARVVVTGKHAHAAGWVEYGTAAHHIKPKSAQSLFFAGIFSTGIDHPGSSAKPFLRPALDSRATEAVVAAGEYIKKRLASKHGLDTSEIEIVAD